VNLTVASIVPVVDEEFVEKDLAASTPECFTFEPGKGSYDPEYYCSTVYVLDTANDVLLLSGKVGLFSEEENFVKPSVLLLIWLFTASSVLPWFLSVKIVGLNSIKSCNHTVDSSCIVSMRLEKVSTGEKFLITTQNLNSSSCTSLHISCAALMGWLAAQRETERERERWQQE